MGSSTITERNRDVMEFKTDEPGEIMAISLALHSYIDMPDGSEVYKEIARKLVLEANKQYFKMRQNPKAVSS